MRKTLSTRKKAYERDFPRTYMPKEVGCFSFDSERRFLNNNRQLRYYTEPPQNPSFDLNVGFPDQYVKRDESVKENLDNILKWITHNKAIFTTTESSKLTLDVDFVIQRGNLTKLLTTPYETKKGWMFAVTRFRGTIYINKAETEETRRDDAAYAERESKVIYSGLKFEKYMCADNIESSPNPSEVVNTKEGYYTVMRTKFAEHKLLFSAEVDCRVKEPKDPPSCYVELKTLAAICTPEQRSNFHRFKLLKWWAQSFIPGVPQVVVGLRDSNGIVAQVKTFQTAEMSQLVEDCWKPTVCMNFCNDFLTWVKEVVSEDDPSVYLFTWELGKDVSVTIDSRKDVDFTIDSRKDVDSQYRFLPEWYKEKISETDK